MEMLIEKKIFELPLDIRVGGRVGGGREGGRVGKEGVER